MMPVVERFYFKCHGGLICFKLNNGMKWVILQKNVSGDLSNETCNMYIYTHDIFVFFGLTCEFLTC